MSKAPVLWKHNVECICADEAQHLSNVVMRNRRRLNVESVSVAGSNVFIVMLMNRKQFWKYLEETDVIWVDMATTHA